MLAATVEYVRPSVQGFQIACFAEASAQTAAAGVTGA